ncbi:MAG: hypothetical protein PHY47_19840 [Lachnospiraceae bacterium]|nr:hypothetical protein [Lachnospiraceae bacterium]
MLPVNCGSHADYQNFILENLRKYYPNPDSIARSTWDIIDRFWNLDLSFTDDFMKPKYSVFGPKLRTPPCMQRSYLLSIDFKVSSVTDWAAQLKINPLYAILSGFKFGDAPGVGTFYDFFSRLLDQDENHLSPHIHPLKTKVKSQRPRGADRLFVKMILPLIRMVFLSVRLVFVYATMVWKKLREGVNSSVLISAVRAAVLLVLVEIPAPMPNTDARFI